MFSISDSMLELNFYLKDDNCQKNATLGRFVIYVVKDEAKIKGLLTV